MKTSEVVTVGTLSIDQQQIVRSGNMPPLYRSNGTTVELIGVPLNEIFLLEDGTPFQLRAEAEENSGQGARLRDGEIVRLFLREGSPEARLLIVIFLQEEILERNAAAHARLRSTLGSVIAGFAHEVRNPIAAIISLTESVLCTPNISEDILYPLSKIPSLVYRIEELLKITLNYGRPQPANPKWHQLQRIIDDAIESMTLAKIPAEAWRVEVPEHPVLIDIGHASSILINLLTNAVQASSPKGVSLRVRSGDGIPPGFTAIDVSDNGRGIPENLQEKIFEPFFTTKAKGTGLGLPLARDLARMNGGDVCLLSSTPGETIFRLLVRNRPPSISRADSQSNRIKTEG